MRIPGRSLRRPIFLLALLFLVVAAGIWGPSVYRTILLGSGFMAQSLCAGIFVSGRDAKDLLAQELSGPRYELLRFFEPTIDREQKRVSASAYGLGRRTSIFRDGLGCTLVIGTTEEALRAQADGLFRAPMPADPDAAWPTGEKVDLSSLPEGVDATALTKAIDAIFAEPDAKRPRRTRALVVVYQGRIVAERYAEGFDADMPLVGWSMSKTATNALTGLRVADGKLVVTENALMPEWRDSNDPRRGITLDDLLRMTSGLRFDETYSSDLSDVTQMLFVQGNAAAYAARKPFVHPPETSWYYSSGSTNIVASVLRQTFPDEREYLRYPRDRLFGPLGMRTAILQPDAAGTFLSASALYASARDWARLGLLFVQDGVWNGERLLPEGWLAYSLRPTVAAPDDRYGAHLWLNLPDSADFGEPPMPRDAFYMLGHDQQVVAMVPSRDLVIVRLGLTRPGGDWDNARELAPLVDAFPERKTASVN